MTTALLSLSCTQLLSRYPYASDFFGAQGLPTPKGAKPVREFLAGLPAEQLQSLGLDALLLSERLAAFLERMEISRQTRAARIGKLTILGGKNKAGLPENVRLELHPGEIIALVGPTGAGKSLLLADIECLAQGDTPSGRHILIDDRAPDEAERLSGEPRLVAQLSQNMNFVMDVSVREFITLHAESRLITDVAGTVDRVFHTAVDLSGEAFGLETQVTALSGGQSRALMIADTAILSASPVVLIDEIENAGVDRRRALSLLVKKEKIVLMATHDPMLALSGNCRLVINHGGIAKVLETTPEERARLSELEEMDARISLFRKRLRQGERICDDAPLPLSSD